MFFTRSNVVHQEVIALKASPKQVREFILTPKRILDYYPSAIEGDIIESGASFYCRGKAGVSLLEVIPAESTEQVLVLKVTTATNIKPPFTADRIKAATFFTMIEDWKLEPAGDGTQLTKTWRDISKKKLRFLPMGLIVRKSAKAESSVLQAAWDRAVQ